ncbi:MAG: hypothetical protein RMK84_10875 [Oscillochloridaceae bacterium]|nr:hypothetical protein [Chloroflexaceae bacterium]MDW8390616.1 hypothetical protein [Oscillochloridaceae bacterium]
MERALPATFPPVWTGRGDRLVAPAGSEQRPMFHKRHRPCCRIRRQDAFLARPHFLAPLR